MSLPTQAQSVFEAGLGQAQAGDLPAAEKAYRQVIRDFPNHAQAHNALGNVLIRQGYADQAIDCYRTAIDLNPEYALAHNNLANALKERGEVESSVYHYKRAAALAPERAEIQLNLGLALRRDGKTRAAVDAFRTAARLAPDNADAHDVLGDCQVDLGNYTAAIESYQRALALQHDHPPALSHLGKILLNLGEVSRSEAIHRRALAARPESVGALNGLARIRLAQGRINEGLEIFRRARELDPGVPTPQSNYLFGLNYLPDAERRFIFEEHAAWGMSHEAGVGQTGSHKDPEDPDRRLRLGYLSPDLWQHSVAFFIEPILEHHDRDRFEVICYADVERPDKITERLRGVSDRWRDIHGQANAQVRERVAADGVDVLVDLAGHTAGNRLALFAPRVAPVQVTYLGYCNTTGLPTMDYRLTDAWADPEGSDAFHTEQLVRLAGGFLCYQAPIDAPPVQARPRSAGAEVTFGSFNTLPKINPQVIEAWSRILAELPASRLMLKNRFLRDASTRERYHDAFRERGIDPARIELRAFIAGTSGHLAAYHEIDLALDTFPYNGTTTTCEALWMGVPVLTVAGDRHAARVGVSLLNQVGLGELVAPSVQAYVQTALALARDRQRLAALRTELRERVRGSSLCDACGHTREIEAAYRTMWRRCCGEAGTPASEDPQKI